MFFAVHEVEAWILSQPELLPAEVESIRRAKTRGEPEGCQF